MDDWKTHFFDQRDGITVTHCQWTATTVTLTIVATNPTAPCPLCAGTGSRIRGRYWRTIADLPWGPCAVTIHLQARKFACPTATCHRQIFTERFPALVAPSARRSRRVMDRCRTLALATNAQTTVRLARDLGLTLSGPTILRLMRQSPLRSLSAPRVIGVDDWAMRKRHTYGTIIVDLECHQVLDLLPDRTAATLAAWLSAHPTIEIVARDRSETYATGITTGAPQALQIADRWHLLHNWAELLERIGNRHRGVLQQCPHPTPPPPPPPSALDELPPRRRTHHQYLDDQRAETRERKQALYDQIHALHAQGFGIRAMAAHLGLCYRTVRKYLQADTCPQMKTYPARERMLDPYEPLMRERWAAGCRNATQIYRDIHAHGYAGSRISVATVIAAWRRHEPPALTLAPAQRSLTVRTAVAVMMRDPTQRTEAEQATIAALSAAHPAFAETIALSDQWTAMIRTQNEAVFSAWIQAARTSTVQSIRDFTRKLLQDEAAVRQACSACWSNGQTEGQVHRLKLVKRLMYGRAGFDLLRIRMLAQG